MSKFFFLIIIQLSFSYSSLFAQINTFERSYQYIGPLPYAGLNSIELPNNESLLLSSSYYSQYNSGTFIYIWKNIIISKLDQNGYTIWRKEIETLPTKYRKTNQILLTNQNEIILIVVQQKDSLNELNILKYDLNGNLIYTAILASDKSIVGCAIIKADSDNYLVAYMGDASRSQINILKINYQLNKIWQKKIYTTPSPSSIEFFIKKWGRNYFSIGYQNKILKIKSNGDSISVINRAHNFTSALNDGSLLISGTKTLTKIDSSNNVVWTRNFLTDPGPAIQTSDGNYVLFVKNSNYLIDSLIKIDDSGNIIWEKIVQGNVYSISENTDMSLLFSGILYDYYIQSYHYFDGPNIWLLKTNSDGNHTAINLVNPIGYENFQTFNTYTIGWYANGVQNINLYYSINDGNSWNLITDNLPADTGQYDWSVPLLFADSTELKIEDSNNPNVFNYTEFPIYISINQPTDKISTNEIFMWIGNNGMGSHDPRTNGSGFYWPGGDSATISAIFADGLVWGGKVNGEIRVNGNTYRDGLQPGRILENGKADDPLATQSKIFKIRKDWQTLPESVFKDRLEYDYNHWPVEAGAPWDDVNEDGVYTPGFDKPKFIGDETLFYVANDLDTTTSRYTYGSDPIGLEFQTTVFGFNRNDLKDVVFKKYKVINKSETVITDMYFDYWADDDMGDANDDYVGCDTLINLGYTFNGDNNDNLYYGTPPPAVGHLIVQPPITTAEQTDSARYGDKWKKGFKNLPLTSFNLVINSNATYSDPDLGNYAGTLQFYNYMEGFFLDGSPIIDPNTGLPTHYCLAGDPVDGTGWYEGLGWPAGPIPGNRRFSFNSGKFNIAPNDTQEVVYAIMMAKGADNINSITKLRELAAHVQEFYDTELIEILNTKQTVAPTGYTLYQNYPNPFNPKTTIEYEVPEKSFVTIKVYDILGREVQTLVNNEEKVRWKYKVQLDASTFASGIYFYRMQTNPSTGSGQSFTETKKMVVLK